MLYVGQKGLGANQQVQHQENVYSQIYSGMNVAVLN